MAREIIFGIEERKIIDFPTSKYKYFEGIEKRLLNKNIRDEIVDKNIDFKEK